LGVYAQRYSAAGVRQGGEFRVNTFTSNNQGDPAVAMDAPGDFIVTWDSYAQDGSDWGIFAQRYNSAGIARGGEFQVNTFTSDRQVGPAVAIDSAGEFVVTWMSYGQGETKSVKGQLYDSNGTAQGGEFQVNSTPALFLGGFAAAINGAKGIVVT